MEKDFIIIDIETTGLDCNFDQITEIGAIKVNGENFQIIESISMLINIKGTVPEFITGLTGITKNLLKKEGIKLKKALIKLSDFSGSLNIYAHNASFDKKFIRNALLTNKIFFIETDWIDTIKIFKKLFPNRKTYKLDSMIKEKGLAEKEKHRALSDANFTLELLKMGNGIKVETFENYTTISNDIFEMIKLQVIKKESSHFFKFKKEMTISLSALLKDSKTRLNEEYIKEVLLLNKTKIIRGRVRRNVPPPNSLIGTAMDQMVEYFYNKEEFIKRSANDQKLPTQIKNILSLEMTAFDFLALAHGISFYRGGSEYNEQGYKDALDQIDDKYHYEQIKIYMKVAEEESERLNENVIFNPIFGSVESGIKADGDYIFDNKLCEMKTSKKPSFNRMYKLQMISYILLNEMLEKPFKLDKEKVIYWNPYFMIFEEYDIKITSEIKMKFRTMLRRYNLFLNDTILKKHFLATDKILSKIRMDSFMNEGYTVPDEYIKKLREIRSALELLRDD